MINYNHLLERSQRPHETPREVDEETHPTNDTPDHLKETIRKRPLKLREKPSERARLRSHP